MSNGLTGQLSEDVITKLRAFAALGRTATPLHLNDQRGFVAFIMAAYKENPEFSATEIKQWCLENGWNGERAEAMANWVRGAVMVLDAQHGRLL